MSNLYVGSRSRFSFAIQNELVSPAVLADPSAFTITIERQGSSTVTFTYSVDADLVRDGVGLYHLDYTMAVTGLHRMTATATGAVAAVAKMQFQVWP